MVAKFHIHMVIIMKHLHMSFKALVHYLQTYNIFCCRFNAGPSIKIRCTILSHRGTSVPAAKQKKRLVFWYRQQHKRKHPEDKRIMKILAATQGWNELNDYSDYQFTWFSTVLEGEFILEKSQWNIELQNGWLFLRSSCVFQSGMRFQLIFSHVAISQNDLGPEIRAVLEPPQIWKIFFLSLIYGLNEKRSRFLLNPPIFNYAPYRHSRGTLGPSKSTKTESFHGVCV